MAFSTMANAHWRSEECIRGKTMWISDIERRMLLSLGLFATCGRVE